MFLVDIQEPPLNRSGYNMTALEKQMGLGCPGGNKWDKIVHKQCNTKPK